MDKKIKALIKELQDDNKKIEKELETEEIKGSKYKSTVRKLKRNNNTAMIAKLSNLL